MSARAPHILVIDDEPDLRELLRLSLTQAGFVVSSAASGEAGIAAAGERAPDLVVLDLMLPDIPGFEVCRRLRACEKTRALPVLMLTAKSEEIDRVVGFELGADDYVAKPFSPRELALRVAAILRRGERAESAGAGTGEDADARVLRHGDIELDAARHRCLVARAPVALTAKEFDLLHALMRRPGRARSRRELLGSAWGDDVTVTERTVDAHLKRLRVKLGDAGGAIETVRGVGYRFRE